MQPNGLFFRQERELRAKATLARDLAASVEGTIARRHHLAVAQRYDRAARGSINERSLILR